MMSDEVLELCLRVLEWSGIPTLDVTGGAPELHPGFRRLIEAGSALGRRVIDRCNLTVTRLPNYRWVPAFLAEHRVEVTASLPYYQSRQTDAQRGDGVFEESIAALRELNALGYGRPGSGLVLNLVTNPVGAFLPPDQRAAERDWKRELERRHGVVFDRLFTITNMPISRFLEHLRGEGANRGLPGPPGRRASIRPPQPASCAARRSRSAWDGTLYDCDFNQMLELPLAEDLPRHIRDFDRRARSAARAHRAGAALLRLHRGRGLKLRRGGRVITLSA